MARTRPFQQKIRIAALWILSAGALALAVMARPLFDEAGLISLALEVTGVLLLISALVGRIWAILYIGPHKNREVVQIGPYSMTRNPLYFFSLLGIFGAGLALGGLTLSLLYGTGFFVIFYLTAREEAAFLAHKFGQAYAGYAARVPLFLPDPRLFNTPDTQTFSVSALRVTFLDGLVFVGFIPLAELLDWLRLHSDFQMIGLY